MSSLIKYNSVVVKNNDNMVIDTNQKVIERLRYLDASMKSTVASSPSMDADGFVSGISAETVEELVNDQGDNAQEVLSKATEDAERIIEEAHKKAEQMIADASGEAESIRQKAKVAGREEGMQAADMELANRKKQLEEEYENKAVLLDAEYEKKMKEMEPELVDILLRVFSKVTHTMAEDKKDMIICLINSVMRNTDLSKEFYIRVSPEDYQFAINNQEKIYNSTARDIHISIVEDVVLSRNQCIIETDAGVFDCSLDIQLDNLIRDIRILSCLN